MKKQCKCAVVVDPPRVGLHKDVIDTLNKFMYLVIQRCKIIKL